MTFNKFGEVTGRLDKKGIEQLYRIFEDAYTLIGKFRSFSFEVSLAIFVDTNSKSYNLGCRDMRVLLHYVSSNLFVKVYDYWGDKKKVFYECADYYGLSKALFYLKLYLTGKGGETFMLPKIIEDHFPKTKEANLVYKWFGKELEENKLMGMLIDGKESTILKHAEELEAEEQEKRRGK